MTPIEKARDVLTEAPREDPVMRLLKIFIRRYGCDAEIDPRGVVSISQLKFDPNELVADILLGLHAKLEVTGPEGFAIDRWLAGQRDEYLPRIRGDDAGALRQGPPLTPRGGIDEV